MMARTTIAVLAATMEIAVPLIVVSCYWHFPAIRQRLAVLLGAITPFFVCYILICAFYPFRDATNPWADAPLQMAQGMSVFPYISTLAVAIGLTFLFRPPTFKSSYFLGLILAPIGGLLLLALIGMLVRAV